MNKSLSSIAALLVAAASLAIAVGAAFAAGDQGHNKSGVTAVAQAANAAEMVDGEVHKVDVDNKRITVKHREIKNLQMPGMTMVFQVKDPAMLSSVKAGDKIQFAAEKSGGALVITQMQPAK